MLDMCGEAPRLSRAKSNINAWGEIRNRQSKDIYLIIIIFIIIINFKSSIFIILIFDLIKKKFKRDKNNRFILI